MKKEDYLKTLKETYLQTRPSPNLIKYGQRQLLNEIRGGEKKTFFAWPRTFALAFGILLIFVGTISGFYKIALASLPGEPLYPIKLLSEKVAGKISGNNQRAIDNRAQEVVEYAKNDGENKKELERSVENYSERVLQERENIEKENKDDLEFEKKLEEQKKKFEEIAKENPEIENEVKGAIEAAQEASHEQENEHN